MNTDDIKARIDKDGYISIADMACGAGATLIAAAETMRDMGLNYQRQALFVGQDIDEVTALMCYIQLSLLGCSGYVVIGDSLINPITGTTLFGEDTERCWYTPMFFHEVWEYRRLGYHFKGITKRIFGEGIGSADNNIAVKGV